MIPDACNARLVDSCTAQSYFHYVPTDGRYYSRQALDAAITDKHEHFEGALYDTESPYVFTTERGGPMSAAGFRKQLARWGAGGLHFGSKEGVNNAGAKSWVKTSGSTSVTVNSKRTTTTALNIRGIWIRKVRYFNNCALPTVYVI